MENPIRFLAVCALGGVLLNLGFWASCSSKDVDKFDDERSVMGGGIVLEGKESESENEFVEVSYPDGLDITT